MAGSQQVTCSPRLLQVPHFKDALVDRLKSAGKLWWLGVSGIMFASITTSKKGFIEHILNIHIYLD